MNIIVVGLGSMGRRRIRLMKQYDPELKIIGIDSNTERALEVSKESGIDTVSSIDEAFDKYSVDAAFICTSPLSHASIIKELVSRKTDLFTEINLVEDGYEDFIKETDTKLFLSSTFLYRKDVQWMIDAVGKETGVNYIYHTGQYLPDWHPWENYKKFFVGDKRTGGCREILAIELPWITKCFGKVKKVNVLKGTLSGLELDYPDNYMIQIEHEGGNKGLLAVDVVARKAIRRIEIFNENLQVYWEGTPASLQKWDIEKKEMESISTYDSIVKDKNYCDNIIENAYMDEIDAFFTWLKGDDSKVYHSFEKDYEILKLIDEIE